MNIKLKKRWTQLVFHEPRVHLDKSKFDKVLKDKCIYLHVSSQLFNSKALQKPRSFQNEIQAVLNQLSSCEDLPLILCQEFQTNLNKKNLKQFIHQSSCLFFFQYVEQSFIALPQ